MIVQNDSFSENFRRTVLNNNTPCSFWMDGKEAQIDWSEPIRVSRNDRYECYERYAELEGGLTAKISYRVYERAIIFGVTLQQGGERSSNLIEKIEFARVTSEGKEFHVPQVQYSRLLYTRGSDAKTNDWQPLDVEVRPVHRSALELRTDRGRGSVDYMPYFNFDLGDGTGFFTAIGHSGHWSAFFLRNPKEAVCNFYYHDASFRLKAGEAVELPQMLVLPWTTDHYTRDLSDTFNLFRRFMKEDILPKPGGKEFHMPVCMRAWGNIDQKGHDIRIGNIKKYGLRAASYGIDAGWYELNGSGTTHEWFPSVGDWIEATDIFPNGIEELSRKAEDAGMGLWMWFEFERAVAGSASVREHSEYYLRSEKNENINMIDMTNPEAREYILQKVARIIDKTKMNIFRVDFNFDPLPYFYGWDEPERKGLTELQYYNGLYRFFERMLEIYPNIVIDNCAGGGRRQDFRMCEYTIPIMCSSDYFCWKDFDPEGIQGHTWGISRWLPITGDSCGSCSGNTAIVMDTYRVRSSVRSSIGLAAPCWELSDEEGAWYQKMIADAETITPYMSLDAYPLTGYTLSHQDWIAWERCDYDGSRGLIMAFRRLEAVEPMRTFALRGLDADATYELTDLDDGFLQRVSGKDLMQGYQVEIPTCRTARVILFHKV